MIIFAAHTHIPAYHKWKMPEGVIRQFVSFSLVTDPDAEISVKRFNGNEYLRSVERTAYEQLDGEDYADLLKFTKKFHGKLKHAIRYRGAAGFNVLRVEGKKVFIDIYSGSWDKPVYTQAIK